MVCIIAVAILAATAHASRDEGSKVAGATESDFQLRNLELPELLQLGAKLHAQPEEKASMTADEVQRRGFAAAADVAEASVGMSALRHQSAELREALAMLSINEELVSTARKAESRAKAASQLKTLAQGSEKVRQMATELDERMQMEYAKLLRSEVADATSKAASLLDENSDAALDRKFAEMEEQTQSIMAWFDQLKEIKQARDAMRKQKDQALKEAESAGLTNAEVQHELSGSSETSQKTLPAQLPQETSPQHLQRLAAKVDSKPVASDAPQKRENAKRLADVVAKSAFEMAQIEGAAGDVMEALDGFEKWKSSQDSSPESLDRAAKVKAKLDKAMKFLEEHEGAVEQHSSEIDDLMRQANLGHLLDSPGVAAVPRA
jgi:hypothetical protein